jgi:hypothetical protein
MTTAQTHQQPPTKLLTCDEALRIARQDAETAYRDLSGYQITLALEADGWHVDYHLTKPLTAGGGPHYVIDPASGAIIKKVYYQ